METLGEIKTQLNDSLALRSKTLVLVGQEFYALPMAHAAIRAVMTEAAQQSAQASEDLSFIHAVQVQRRGLPAQAARGKSNPRGGRAQDVEFQSALPRAAFALEGANRDLS